MAVPATWPGEKRLYEKQFYAVLRRRTKIIDIPPEEGELGYTSKDGSIHEAYAHPIMDGLSGPLQVMFRYGVFTHETLHQVFTSFFYLEEVLDRHREKAERKVLSLFANLVEDPSIEYFASDIFGGEMLEALNFSIRRIYKMSPDLSESSTPFTQLTNALVMFGDMGLLKGSFTFPEAEECFSKIAPEFNRMVVCPDPHARIDAAERWTVLTRPLWKKEAEEQEGFLQMLQQLLDELMNGGMEGSGDASERPEKGQSDERSERRKAFAEALEEEQEEKSSMDGTGESEAVEDDSSEGEGSVPDGNAEEKKEVSSEKDGSGKKSAGSRQKAVDRFQDDGSGREDGYPETAAENIWEKAREEAEKAADETEDTLDLPVDMPKSNGRGSGKPVRCLNYRAEAADDDALSYGQTVSKNARDIKMLTSSLRNLLRADYDDYLRATSGRYALKRDLDHTSVKIFDKRKERKNVDDMAVMLLVDSSGSMSGNKMSLARETAVVLAETFAALKIPCYIMGFTADAAGSDVVHAHYVSWKNSRQERVSLVQLHANANNDDGYSIRYAAQVLKRRRAEHKILFVISDGAPACSRYRYADGVKDTALAIREAKKVADVFGVGIGMTRCEELKGMYAGAFVEVRNVGELTRSLAKQLKRVIRAWL